MQHNGNISTNTANARDYEDSKSVCVNWEKQSKKNEMLDYSALQKYYDSLNCLTFYHAVTSILNVFYYFM